MGQPIKCGLKLGLGKQGNEIPIIPYALEMVADKGRIAALRRQFV